MVTTNPIMLRLNESDALVRFLDRMYMEANEWSILLKGGFNTQDSLLEIYHNTENTQQILKNLNKTFGYITRTLDKSYFPTTIMRQHCGLHWFMNIMVSGLSQVPDIDLFDVKILNWYTNEYGTSLSIRDRLERTELKIPKFKKSSSTYVNWPLILKVFP